MVDILIWWIWLDKNSVVCVLRPHQTCLKSCFFSGTILRTTSTVHFEVSEKTECSCNEQCLSYIIPTQWRPTVRSFLAPSLFLGKSCDAAAGKSRCRKQRVSKEAKLESSQAITYLPEKSPSWGEKTSQAIT